MSTRRVADNLSFDYGAQYFIARDRRFKRYVESWIEDGYVALWVGRIVVVERDTIKAKKADDSRYIAVPGMNSLGKHIASDLNVHLETKVVAPTRTGVPDTNSLSTPNGIIVRTTDPANYR